MTTDTKRQWVITTTTDRAALLVEALEIAQNSLEFDGDRAKADAIALLIFDIQNACTHCGKVREIALHGICNVCYYGLKETN